MSIITIQVGQCGNQIGQAIFDQLADNIAQNEGEAATCSTYVREKVVNTFFDRTSKDKMTAKAILLDMEPKVVLKCLNARNQNSSHNWAFDSKMSYYKQGGSGNNWALGYRYLGDEEYSEVGARMQSLLEKQDYFQGFHVVNSLAGGTGSGLGAHLIQRMRDDYSKSIILNTAIWPYSHGEVILQNYNVLLTLASSLEHASAILPLYNDDILNTCKNLLKEKRPSYSTMNKVIAQSLLSFLFPCGNSTKQTIPLYNNKSSYCTGPLNVLSEIQEHLLTHQSDYYKLLSLKNIPQCSQKMTEFNTDLWDGMINRIRQMMISNSGEDQINWNVKADQQKKKFGGQNVIKSIGNMLFLRGDGVYNMQSYDQGIMGIQQNRGLYTDQKGLCAATGLRTYKDSFRIFGHEKTVCILSNNQSHNRYLERTLRRGTQMRIEKAFLHHYDKFGVDNDMIDQAFMKCEETLEAYKQLG